MKGRKGTSTKRRASRRPTASGRKNHPEGNAAKQSPPASRVKELTDLMQSMQLFEGVPAASLRRIAEQLRRRPLSKGAVVTR